MMQANLKNDVEPLVEVKGLLADLRATWAQAIEINRAEKLQATGVTAAAPKATAANAPMGGATTPLASAAAGMGAYKPLAMAM